MTVPQQRDEPSVSTLILGGVQELKTSLDRLTARFDALDQKFMPRDQVVDRFATVSQALADQRAALVTAKSEHDADIKRLADRMDDEQQRRTTARHWLIGICVPAVLTLCGLVIAALAIALG